MADNDIDKWTAAPTNGDIARALVVVRGGMIELNNAIVELMAGNLPETKAHLSAYTSQDTELKRLIYEIGGLGTAEGR